MQEAPGSDLFEPVVASLYPLSPSTDDQDLHSIRRIPDLMLGSTEIIFSHSERYHSQGRIPSLLFCDGTAMVASRVTHASETLTLSGVANPTVEDYVVSQLVDGPFTR